MALLSDVFPQCQEADGPRGVFIKAEQRKPVEVPRRDEQRDNSQSGCSVEPRAPCQGSCGMAQLYELLHQCQEVDGPQPVVTVSVPELQQRSAHQQSALQFNKRRGRSALLAIHRCRRVGGASAGSGRPLGV